MKEGRTLFPCLLIVFLLLLPRRLPLPQAYKWRQSQWFGSLLNIQVFNSFHLDATETQSAVCLCSAFSLHGSDESSAGPRFLIKALPASLFYFFLLHLNEFLQLPTPPTVLWLMAVLLLTPLNRWTNQHAGEEEKERERSKTATGESVSINCRWRLDAIQLLRVILLLLLLRKDSRGEREGERGR